MAVMVAGGRIAGPGCSSGAHRNTGGEVCDCALFGAIVVGCDRGWERPFDARLRFCSGDGFVLRVVDGNVGIVGGGTAVSVRGSGSGSDCGCNSGDVGAGAVAVADAVAITGGVGGITGV